MDINTFKAFIDKQQWDDLADFLAESFKIDLDEKTGQPQRLVIQKEHISCLEDILKVAVGNETVLLKETYKSLRNAVVLNEDVQRFIINETELLKHSLKFLHETIEERREVNWECGKIVLQFLINLVVGNRESSEAVWKVFSGEFVALLEEIKFAYHGSALLYNILLLNKKIVPSSDLVGVLLNKVDEENEFAAFLIEHCVENENVVEIYNGLDTSGRIVFLEVIKQNLIELKHDFKVHKKLVPILIRDFKNKSDCILKTVADYLNEIEPYEVVLLLDILATISSNNDYIIKIQSDKSLLINCAFLLRSIHDLGIAYKNSFSIIQKLSEINVTNENLNQHPAFGFKASLIRLLGNLSWKNKANQDELREHETIPLLLDNCNIDARNPFITQWTILAVRNLCEGNLENQALIASLTQKGVVNSSLLEDMGITLHSDDNNTLQIVPVDLSK